MKIIGIHFSFQQGADRRLGIGEIGTFKTWSHHI